MKIKKKNYSFSDGYAMLYKNVFLKENLIRQSLLNIAKAHFYDSIYIKNRKNYFLTKVLHLIGIVHFATEFYNQGRR